MSDPWPALVDRVREFARVREWEQFHTPKNLAMAIAGEAGELCAELQWTADFEPDQEVPQRLLAALQSEAADVLLYLVRFADACGFDLLEAADQKITVNEGRYPPEASRGRATKYSNLGENEA